MKKSKYMFNEDLSADDFHLKQAEIFRHEFAEELLRQSSSEDVFHDELKHIQKMVFRGKLNPQHKQILEEWRNTHPDRFDNFCNQMNEENRHKLLHFLHLDEDDDE